MKPAFTITRRDQDRYSAVSNIPMADGSVRADYFMRLDAGALRSDATAGVLRVGGTLTLNLGPVSYAAVARLAIGESVTL